jgi:DNA-binding transcriptional LysR family regulator
MWRENLADLEAFLAVAREGSFTRAASGLGVSQSALSQTVKNLEARLGIRLLTRTTRKVSLTEAGERLFHSAGPRLEEIQAELASLTDLRERPSGTVRITSTEYAASAILWPKLSSLLPCYPDVKLEVIIDYGLTDIVGERVDAGVRPGGIVSPGMISVPIGPPLRMAVVGSPSYFEKRGTPKVPQDLTGHSCINLRLPSNRGLYAWEFEKKGRELKVRVDGQLAFNTSAMILTASLDGLGLAYLMEGHVEPYLADGRLVRVLGDWCEPFDGYHLYYPSRRQPTSAFTLVVNALRYRGG